ncbi:MAG: LamG domain-containing protein, partial [Anaerolineales bacterium]
EIGDPSLVAWWMLDEGSGTTAVDYSGHEHHATIAGTGVFVTGYDGGALDFDGKNVYIDMDDRIAEGTFTCTMWLKPRDIPYSSGFYSILHDDVWNAGSCHVHLRANTSLLNWEVNSGPNLSSTTVLEEDEWYHFAVAIDADATGQGQLYVNGILEDTQPGGTGTPFLGPLNFGAWTNNQRYYHGLMDDIRVYDKVLTQEEILLVMRIDPLLAWQASPANGSTPDLDNATPLTWSAGDDASSHEVYFGTDADAVANADTSDTTGVYSGSQNATSFTPAEGVEWGGGPYYWRIDENNSDGMVTTGRVWSFTVADFILVDDFEGYTDNDAANEAIWQYWIDGFGVPTNGSQVGNLMPPYAEQTIIHGGGQSMPLAYDNTAGVRNSEAVLALAAPRDWTKHGVSALSLWVRGYPPSVGSFTEGPVGAFTMTAAGSDIWGTSDQFHFAYKTLTGPGTIVARVDSVQETHAWAKAGVMIRESLNPDSKFAFMLVSAASGVAFQGRTDTGASAVGTTEADVAAPHWVRLERDVAGNFTASHSANGSAWAPVGTAVPLNIPMDGTVYVGLALTSRVAAETCEAKLSNVTITGNAGPQWVN